MTNKLLFGHLYKTIRHNWSSGLRLKHYEFYLTKFHKNTYFDVGKSSLKYNVNKSQLSSIFHWSKLSIFPDFQPQKHCCRKYHHSIRLRIENSGMSDGTRTEALKTAFLPHKITFTEPKMVRGTWQFHRISLEQFTKPFSAIMARKGENKLLSKYKPLPLIQFIPFLIKHFWLNIWWFGEIVPISSHFFPFCNSHRFSLSLSLIYFSING